MAQVQIREGQIADLQITTTKIAASAITAAKLGAIAGSGLSGGSGSALSIGTGAVSDAMLAGSITDGKLSTISTANKVSGSALQLASGSGLEDDSGIKISASGVTDAMLAGSISFSKLSDAANIARLDQAENVGAVWAFGGNIPTASANPSSDNQLARKAYVDSVAQGASWHDSCKAATTANITLSGTQTVDGISLAADDRCLVKNQSSAAENGLYLVKAGAWARAADQNAAGEFDGAAVFVTGGTVNGEHGFVCTTTVTNVGTDAVSWTQFTGLGTISAGDGLSKSGNEISADLAANKGLEFSSAALAVKVNAAAAMQVDANGIGLNVGQGVEVNSNALRVKLDGSTLARGANGVKVNDNSLGLGQMSFRWNRNAATGNGSATTFDLGHALHANFTAAVMVYKNGLLMDVAGSPANADEYSVSATGGSGGVGRVTFGAAPGANDQIRIVYPY